MSALWLTGTRFLAGIGPGAEPPLADTYLTDLLPARKRRRFIARAHTLAFLGVPVVGFLGHLIAEQTILGAAGRRWMFAIGAVGAGSVFLLRRGLPESRRWLESVGRTAEAEEIVERLEDEARADGHPGRGARGPGAGTGRHRQQAARGPRTAVRSPHPDDRLRARRCGAGPGVRLLRVDGAHPGPRVPLHRHQQRLLRRLHIYQTEILPTRLRGTASSGTYSLSRLATAAMPFVLVPILSGAGAGASFAVVCVAMVVLAVDVAALGPRTTGGAL